MTEYFKHDYGARNSDKVIPLRMGHGWEGYGLFWGIVEILYESGGCIKADASAIAFSLQADKDRIEDIISLDLFYVTEDGYLRSKAVDRRLAQRLEKTEKTRAAALVKWKAPTCRRNASAMQTHSKRIANAEQTQCRRNADAYIGEEIQEKRVDTDTSTATARPLTPLQEVVEAYRLLREGAPTEGKALSMFYGRNVKAAKELLEVLNGDVEKAKAQIKTTAAHWPARGMNWSLETAIKDAVDPERLKEHTNVRNTGPQRIVGEAAPVPGKYDHLG